MYILRSEMRIINRLKVLKKTGVGAVSVSPVADVVSSKTTPDTQFVGITYDPITLEESGEVSASLSRGQDSIKGEMNMELEGIDVPTSNIPVNINGAESIDRFDKISQVNNPTTSSEFETHVGGEFKKEGKPLKLRISSVADGWVSGLVGRPGYSTDSTAFVLAEKETGKTETKLRNEIRNPISKRRRRK